MKQKNKNMPMRRCVGCMESKPKDSLIRITGYENQVMIDPTGKAKGRGIYLCKNNRDCAEKARKKNAINRGLNMKLTSDECDEIIKSIVSNKY